MIVYGNNWTRQEEMLTGSKRKRVIDVKDWDLRKLKVVLETTPLKRGRDFIFKNRKINFKFLLNPYSLITIYE